MEVFHLLAVLCCFFITGASVKSAKDTETLYPVQVGPTEPCDDLYSFTCSTWDSKNTQGPIPESEKLLDKSLKGILSEQHEITIPSRAVEKAKSMYKTCLNSKSRHKASLLKKLRDFGGWPILDANWKNSQYTWEKLTASLRRLGYSFLIKINIHPDELNVTRHKIVLSSVNPSSASQFQSETGTDGEYFQNYGRFIERVVRYMGTDFNSTWPPTSGKQIRDILSFQANLDKIPRLQSTARYAKITSKTAANIRMKTAQLTLMTSRAFDWQQLFDSIFDGLTSVSNNVRIIEVKDLNYIKKIVSLLEKTDPRTISNFLLWKFVEDVAEDGDEMLVAINSEYHKNLSGNSPSKQDTCLKEVKGFMGYAVTNLIANIKPQNIISKVKEVAKYVHQTYKDLVYNATWINEPTRSNLLNKLDHLQINIGYPEWILSNSHLDHYYRQVNTGDDHFANVMSASEAYAFEELSQLDSVPDRNSWSITPVMTNAFYNTILDTVYIPLAILQVPIVDPSWPMSMIFGSVGAVIGHEMSHSFEDSQLYGDHDTSQSNIYDRQTECINKLHSAFCPFRGTEGTANSIAIRTIYQNLCVNGWKTLHENVADFNGIQAAFKAFQAWRKVGIEDGGTAENLGGFAPNQLFFIGYGRMWCGSAKNFGLVHQILTSYNAPNRYRLTGSLSSLAEEFRETFMCQVAPAAEKPSCKIW